MNIIYTVRDIIKTAFLAVLMTALLLIILFMAVLQQSYRMTPPTDEELQDNPALIIYRGE